jgi:uncharacterized RDD family membrane protein YckC
MPEQPTPSLWRRLACFVYEGVLLFGVVAPAGLLYAVITNQRHALIGTHGLQAWLFAVIGLYFIWFWSRHGQTLAMRTWHIRVTSTDGQALSRWRAAARYLLSWMWFLPALLTLYLAELKSGAGAAAVLTAGVLGYAALTRLHPSRQYWHDALCGSRLIDTRTGVKAPNAAAESAR